MYFLYRTGLKEMYCFLFISPLHGGHRGHDCMVVFYGSDLQLPMQSVPITTNVVSSNSAHGVVYSIQHYVIKFDNDLRQVDGFLRVKLTATI